LGWGRLVCERLEYSGMECRLRHCRLFSGSRTRYDSQERARTKVKDEHDRAVLNYIMTEKFEATPVLNDLV